VRADHHVPGLAGAAAWWPRQPGRRGLGRGRAAGHTRGHAVPGRYPVPRPADAHHPEFRTVTALRHHRAAVDSRGALLPARHPARTAAATTGRSEPRGGRLSTTSGVGPVTGSDMVVARNATVPLLRIADLARAFGGLR